MNPGWLDRGQPASIAASSAECKNRKLQMKIFLQVWAFVGLLSTGQRQTILLRSLPNDLHVQQK
jgi:hypothetical protein